LSVRLPTQEPSSCERNPKNPARAGSSGREEVATLAAMFAKAGSIIYPTSMTVLFTSGPCRPAMKPGGPANVAPARLQEDRWCGFGSRAPECRAIPTTAPASPAGRRRTSFQKGPALLPPYTTGSVRIRSNLDIKLGRVIGGWQCRAADRRCASRCGHSLRGASGLGVAFVGALCRRIDSQDCLRHFR
jgi:hypothetical protein